MLYQRILEEKKRLEKQISHLNAQLQTYPDGTLICARNGNNFKWYQSNGKRPIYIPKKNRVLAEQLAIKKYLSLKLEDLLQEKKAVDCYLRHYTAPSNQSEKLLTDQSEYQNLLSPFFKPFSEKVFDWMNSPYEKNPKFPDQRTHKTSSGNLVRSKSEALIDTLLYMNKIPFRYECALQLGEITIYPDFTILHPSTLEIYYWENFGLMDQPSYCQHTFSKLQLYASNRLIPGIQLITTFETKEHPLAPDTIDKIIHEYFL